MADLRIVDAPEIPTENITGKEKLPTGGNGNYSISLDSVADYTKTKKDLVDNTSVDGKINGVRQELESHIEDLLNPHQVTKGQIGLGNVDNTADLDKPVSNSTQSAIISAVAPKADKTYVDNSLSSKSDKTYVDTKLELKANKVDVYTKSETYTKQESNGLVDSSVSTALTPVNASLELAKRGIINRYDSSLTYNSGERAVLTNGDIVKSAIDGNTNDPNVDMTGWVKVNDVSQIFDESGKTQQQLNNIQFKFPFVNVMYYGALGIGDTSIEEDSAAFLAAWNVCIANNGGTIVVPKPKNWYAMKAQYFRDGKNISIIGYDSLIKSAAPSSGAWSPFHFSNCDNLKIKGMQFDGDYLNRWSNAAPNNRINNGNVVFHDSRNVEIFECQFDGSGYNTGTIDVFGDGIYVGSITSHSFNIHHNTFLDDGRWSVAVTNGIKNFFINDNKVVRSGKHTKMLGFVDIEIGASGAAAQAMTNIEICRNNCKGNVGVYMTQNLLFGFKNVKIEDNHFDQVFEDGVQKTGLYSFGISVSKLDTGASIRRNVFRNCWKDTYSVSQSRGFELSGNTFISDAEYAHNGTSCFLIVLSSDFLVENNTVSTANKMTIIDVRTSTSYTIGRNTLRSTHAETIYISALNSDNSKQATVQQNTIYDDSVLSGGEFIILLGSVAVPNAVNLIDNTVYSVSGSSRILSKGGLIKDNNLVINNRGATWLEDNTCINPDKNSMTRNIVRNTIPTIGSYKVGDIIRKNIITADKIYGWVCTTAGIGSSAVWSPMMHS